MLEHPEADIRGRTVFDQGAHALGDVGGLIIDEDERRVRFPTKRLMPVDAVVRIDDVSVHLDRTGEEVAQSAEYDPSIVPAADFYEDLYFHYAYAPFWIPGSSYPYPPG